MSPKGCVGVEQLHAGIVLLVKWLNAFVQDKELYFETHEFRRRQNSKWCPLKVDGITKLSYENKDKNRLESMKQSERAKYVPEMYPLLPFLSKPVSHICKMGMQMLFPLSLQTCLLSNHVTMAVWQSVWMLSPHAVIDTFWMSLSNWALYAYCKSLTEPIPHPSVAYSQRREAWVNTTSASGMILGEIQGQQKCAKGRFGVG